MVSAVKTQHDEASKTVRTFDLVRWIRARRMQWLGHILRMEPSRLVKKTVQLMFESPQEGDLLMNEPIIATWENLCKMVADRKKW